MQALIFAPCNNILLVSAPTLTKTSSAPPARLECRSQLLEVRQCIPALLSGTWWRRKKLPTFFIAKNRRGAWASVSSTSSTSSCSSNMRAERRWKGARLEAQREHHVMAGDKAADLNQRTKGSQRRTGQEETASSHLFMEHLVVHRDPPCLARPRILEDVLQVHEERPALSRACQGSPAQQGEHTASKANLGPLLVRTRWQAS